MTDTEIALILARRQLEKIATLQQASLEGMASVAEYIARAQTDLKKADATSVVADGLPLPSGCKEHGVSGVVVDRKSIVIGWIDGTNSIIPFDVKPEQNDYDGF